MADLKELREKQEKILADARAKLDEITDDVDESRAKEIESEYDRAMADYDKLDKQAQREEDLAKRSKLLADRQSDLEAIDTSRRPGGEDRAAAGAGDSDGDHGDAEARNKAYRTAFRNFLRYGSEGLSAEERKLVSSRREEIRGLLGDAEARAQGVGTAGAGGALVPEGFMNELMISLKAYGPMNDGSVVRVLDTATGAAMPWPTLDDTSNKGALIAENAQVTSQDATFGTKTLDAFKYTSKLVLVSSELLQDSVVDVEQVVRNAMSERIGRILNQHFTTGSGSSQPNGIVTAASAGVTTASYSAVTADEIIDLEHSVDPAYRTDPSCGFMFDDTVFKAIRKLKDGQGNYLWMPKDLRTGSPAAFLGYPYYVNQDMASFDTSSPIGGGQRIMIFGALNRYIVRRVRAFAVRRLTERYADYDQVGFIGFTRADGELLDTAAVKYMTT